MIKGIAVNPGTREGDTNCLWEIGYSSANKIFAVLWRNRSDPLSRAMGCIGELRTATPAQQGMSGLVRETSHLWLYSSPSPSLQPILREPATSILIVLYTFECIM